MIALFKAVGAPCIVYGEVGRSPVFADALGRALDAVWKDGARATLTRYLAG